MVLEAYSGRDKTKPCLVVSDAPMQQTVSSEFRKYNKLEQPISPKAA